MKGTIIIMTGIIDQTIEIGLGIVIDRMIEDLHIGLMRDMVITDLIIGIEATTEKTIEVDRGRNRSRDRDGQTQKGPEPCLITEEN